MAGANFARRNLLTGLGAAAVATQLPFATARAAAKYTRHNVTSAAGVKMLASYAKGVEAMLKLPADDPRNWFRNAFIHLMDCPHGNWWFYVWHRGYVGYFEQTIRELSGDSSFALPYWDWTQLPQIPDAMFDGVLTPTDRAFEPFTGNLALFTSFIKPALKRHWDSLSTAQQAQLNARGYKEFDNLWNDVTGFDSKSQAGISGNEAFAITCGARYLSRSNSRFDEKTAYDVSPFVINAGLQLPTDFYNPQIYLSFTSSKTPSHNTQPSDVTKFSLLEALPHNKVHNYIGGVGPIDPGPYGNMTNFLSPVDPIFFLHHSNMDRLWDVWTRKQKSHNLPYLPAGDDLKTFSDEPFLFFVDADGHYAGNRKAGDYLSTDVFDYDYEPGFGEAIFQPPAAGVTAEPAVPLVEGTISGNAGSVPVPRGSIERHLTTTLTRPLTALVTLSRPGGLSTMREFDVLVNAPAGVTQVSSNSPYYAGTIAFFGPMMPGMTMSMDATFAVPLPRRLQAFTAPGAAANVVLNIQVVPSNGASASAPVLRALSVGTP